MVECVCQWYPYTPMVMVFDGGWEVMKGSAALWRTSMERRVPSAMKPREACETWWFVYESRNVVLKSSCSQLSAKAKPLIGCSS